MRGQFNISAVRLTAGSIDNVWLRCRQLNDTMRSAMAARLPAIIGRPDVKSACRPSQVRLRTSACMLCAVCLVALSWDSGHFRRSSLP
jgi:hypothetical protein